MANELDPLTAPAPQPTGALVVMFREGCDAGVARSTIEARVGRKPICSSEYGGKVREFTTVLHQQGLVYFHEFNLAIVDPGVSGLDEALVRSLTDSEDVASVRPEYWMHASGGWLCRLFGFGRREKASHEVAAKEKPVETAPASPAAAVPAEAQSPEVRLPTKPEQPSVEAEQAAAEGEITWGVRAVGADLSAFSAALPMRS